MMKTRVTLTLDPEVSHRGKLAARARGTTFSGLVEQLLGAHAPRKNKANLPFQAKWKGKLTLAKKSEARMDYLKDKYQLPIEVK